MGSGIRYVGFLLAGSFHLKLSLAVGYVVYEFKDDAETIRLLQDRRPITPPPCIRLTVRDATTRELIDMG